MNEAKKRKLGKEDIVTYVTLPILTFGSVAMLLFTQLPIWIRVIVSVFIALLGISTFLFHFFHFYRTYKIIFVVLSLLFVVIPVYIFLERSGFLAIFDVSKEIPDRNSVIQQNLKAYLESKGKWATLMFIILQFAQTTILPIPSFLLTGAGSLLFGPVYNSCISLIGVILGSVVAFYVGRIFGYKLVAWIVGKEPLKKALHFIKGKDTVVLTLMFLLPFFPDDLLCFVAGLSSMGNLYFVIVIIISKVLVVFGTSFMVELIPFNTWWGLTIWGVFVLLTVILFIYAFKKGDKIQAYFAKKFERFQKKDTGNDFAQDIIEQIDHDEKGESERADQPDEENKSRNAHQLEECGSKSKLKP